MKTNVDQQVEELFSILKAQMEAKSYFTMAVTVNRLSKYFVHFTEEEEDFYNKAIDILDTAQENDDNFEWPEDTE